MLYSMTPVTVASLVYKCSAGALKPVARSSVWYPGNQLMSCPDICDPLNGRWESYYDPGIDDIFEEAPVHKVVELETAADYYEYQCDNPDDIIQEVPGTIGTRNFVR